MKHDDENELLNLTPSIYKRLKLIMYMKSQ